MQKYEYDKLRCGRKIIFMCSEAGDVGGGGIRGFRLRFSIFSLPEERGGGGIALKNVSA